MDSRATFLSIFPLFLLLTPLVGCVKESPQATSSGNIQPVWAIQPTLELDNRSQSYTGVIKARLEADLGFRVSGKIRSRLVDVGALVKKGDSIALLDSTDYDLASRAAANELASAKAAARRATLDEERLRRIRESAAASQQDYDSAKASAETATENMARSARNLEIAQNRLGYCKLTADFDGVVTAVFCEAGQVVAEGQAVVRIAGLGEREAVVGIPENQVTALPRRKATVTLWSNQSTTIDAKLRELSPIADQATRTFQARFTLLGEEHKPDLGMTASVHLSLPSDQKAFSLPSSAVFSQSGQDQVWVIDPIKETVTSRPIKISEYRQDRVIISQGLIGNEWVVRLGVNKLDPGMKIRILEKGQ